MCRSNFYSQLKSVQKLLVTLDHKSAEKPVLILHIHKPCILENNEPAKQACAMAGRR